MIRDLRMPDHLFLAALLRRAAFFWVGVRVLFVLVQLVFLGELTGGAPALPLRAAAAAVLLTGFLGLLEARRRNEHIFLGNLGVRQAMLAAISAAPAAALEVLAAVLAGLVRV